jgi:hypothetical protein
MALIRDSAELDPVPKISARQVEGCDCGVSCAERLAAWPDGISHLVRGLCQGNKRSGLGQGLGA